MKNAQCALPLIGTSEVAARYVPICSGATRRYPWTALSLYLQRVPPDSSAKIGSSALKLFGFHICTSAWATICASTIAMHKYLTDSVCQTSASECDGMVHFPNLVTNRCKPTDIQKPPPFLRLPHAQVQVHTTSVQTLSRSLYPLPTPHRGALRRQRPRSGLDSTISRATEVGASNDPSPRAPSSGRLCQRMRIISQHSG